MLRVLFAEHLGSVNEVLTKYLGSVSVRFMHSLRNVEERMRNVNKKKFKTCEKCDRCVLSTFYGAFGKSSWSVYEYSKPLRVNGKSTKCLRNVKIFCSHFFNVSTSFTFSSGKYYNSSRLM